MPEILDEISQISIYLKEEQERVNEIALFQPLAQKAAFDEESKPISQRKWSYTQNLPFLRRMTLKVQAFLFKKAPIFIPAERITSEAKFKTVLALLLAQESLREFFFSQEARRENFFEAAKSAAESVGYTNFSPPSGELSPYRISQQLTTLTGKGMSLIDDLTELNLQMAALTLQERNEILFQILNSVERPPITSILEVMHGDETEEISLTTKYAKYKIRAIDQDTGRINYQFLQDQATSSIRTQNNLKAGVKGVMNQRCALDAKTGEWIGSYSGELSHKNHILEQLFFILDIRGEEIHLLDEAPQAQEQTILLTSLYSWHEMSAITEQHKAIRSLNKKVLKIGSDRYIQLNLIHTNISFNAFNKFPIPAELGAVIRDINDQAMIPLITAYWKRLGLENPTLNELHETIDQIAGEKDFLKYQDQLLAAIDHFQALKPELIKQLEKIPQNEEATVALALIKRKKSDGKALKGMDYLLYLNWAAETLGYRHNKNCQNSTDRSAGANGADKAQHVFYKLNGRPFLPGEVDEREIALFKVLYSMYLVWEEPELNAALSTGFIGEKFYHNFFQRNPETTRYMIQWLKKHPEIYLGLSDQRS